MELKTGAIDTVIAETKCVQAAALVVQGITPVSSKVPTEVAAAVVPVVWASGTAGEWKRAEPVGENGASGQEEEKPRDSSLSPSQPLNCLPGNGGMGWTLDCSLCMCGSPLQELQELLVPPGPMDWTPQPLHSCPATGSVSSGGTASPAGEVGRAFAGLVGHIYSSGMEPGKCTELSQGIERDQAREVKKEGRREVRQQASSTKFLCKQGITPVSSKVPTEVAAAVVPVVWASGTAGEWKRAEPVGITPDVGSLLVRPSQYPLKSECQLGLVAGTAEFAPPGLLVGRECQNLPRKPMAKMID
ncbi:uncharacterized protein LOC135417691 [Pseudopipra pipra]|uniref:uncharacterized protein LOC135417691 n=1 Tax=Pseudopipra pipra TaxID=415032 RepID=UPI003138F72F